MNFPPSTNTTPPPNMHYINPNILVVAKKWCSTPLGIVIIVGGLTLGTELMFMTFEDFFIQTFGFSDKMLHIIDAATVTLAVSPALYFFVFRNLKEAISKFRTITVSAQDAIIMMDNEQRISFWNPAAERIFGYTRGEALGQELHSLIAPEEVRKAFKHGFKHFAQSGEGPVVGKLLEVTAVRKSGEKFPIELSISATEIDGKWHAIGIIRDITSRKETETAMKMHEEELRRLNQKLQVEKKEIELDMAGDEALLASLGEGVIATDNNGVITTVNNMAEDMLGWRASEIVGKVLTEALPVVDDSGKIIPKDKRVINIVLACTDTSRPTSLHNHPFIETVNYIKKDSGRIPVNIVVTPAILNDKIIGAVVTLRDITKDKELEKTRGDLLALASHQLRTPLSGTKWLIETLQSGLKGALNEDQKEYLSEIYNINQRMTSLVSDMLGVLRMEGSTEILTKRNVSTGEIFDTILETFTPVAKGKQLALVLDRDGEHNIETDPVLLRNILESFISNAMNYSNTGSEVLVSLKEESHELIFSVKDSGIGIPKDEQARLFERFYRASNAKIFNTHGTGLGLYIAATLAEKIGAHLTFESEEGKGSTFFVHLPYPSVENLSV